MELYDLIEKGKVKRYLSAKNKVVYPGGVYHITHRAPGREVLFLEDTDYLRMLALLKKTAQKFQWDIFAFVLMKNHFHVLLRIKEANLSQGMKKLCESYAMSFNAKYERKGSVFSRPYRAALCVDDVYLLAISLYIHLNPLKARICESLDEYRWSSLDLYKRDKKKSFVNADSVLNVLSNDRTLSTKKYKNLLQQMTQLEFKNIIERPRFIEFFCEKTRGYLRKNSNLNDRVEEELLKFKDKKRLREPKEIQARKYLIEQLLARGYSVLDIARRLNLTRKAVYDIINYTK